MLVLLRHLWPSYFQQMKLASAWTFIAQCGLYWISNWLTPIAQWTILLKAYGLRNICFKDSCHYHDSMRIEVWSKLTHHKYQCQCKLFPSIDIFAPPRIISCLRGRLAFGCCFTRQLEPSSLLLRSHPSRVIRLLLSRLWPSEGWSQVFLDSLEGYLTFLHPRKVLSNLNYYKKGGLYHLLLIGTCLVLLVFPSTSALHAQYSRCHILNGFYFSRLISIPRWDSIKPRNFLELTPNANFSGLRRKFFFLMISKAAWWSSIFTAQLVDLTVISST